jgi:hypothetical protein
LDSYKEELDQASKRNIIPEKKIIGSTTLEDQLRTEIFLKKCFAVLVK